MGKGFRWNLLVVLVVLVVAFSLFRCSDGKGGKADTVSAPDSTVYDTASDSTGDAGDAGKELAASDGLPDSYTEVASVCAQYSGGYRLNTTCQPKETPISSTICVKQDGCNVTMYVGAPALAATASTEGLVGSGGQPAAVFTLETVADSALVSYEDTAGNTFKCEGIALPGPVADLTSYCCEVVAQNCPGANEKCGLVSAGQGGSIVTACLPQTGTVTEGAPCVRASEELEGYGHDDCANGLFCSSLLYESLEARQCLKLCKSEPDCNQGDLCLSSATAPATGVCTATCDPFAPVCPEQLGCTVLFALSGTELKPAGVCMISKRLPEGSPVRKDL